MKTLKERVATSMISMILGGLLAVITAGSTLAESDDVSIGATVSGSTVTTTITNGTEGDIVCGLVGLSAADDIVNPDSVAVFRAANVNIEPGLRDFVFAAVPDGNYLIHWICRENEGPGEDVWGSSPLPETAYAKSGTAQPLPLRVSTDTCFDSVCLPPGADS
ncbi:hypothetical protein [Rhodococcus marinonascens]|uniref:hypothetical protein n=1 Tax=Rhodococcus marinonascens TaxID=38311 RepID=UPI0009338D29|nr:hypothetical protein [Rhodococcus marinonascens]